MPSIGIDRDAFLAELDQAGAEEVRVRLATKIYGNVNEKGALAREWLLRHDQKKATEIAQRQDEFAREQLDIATSAKDAAWKSANEAAKSSAAATRANYISTAALLIALAALISSFWKQN
jgi:hypothetical protein